MAETKKTAEKKTSSKQSDSQKAKAERVRAGLPITGSGLAGVSQDDLNPAFAPPKD